MSEWLGPTDRWPNHPYPEARKALEEARHAGWWLKTAGGSAHGYGVLYCRRAADREYCRFPVWTTGGSDAEDTAHRIRDRVARCQHGDLDTDEPAPTPLTALRGAHFHLDRAERLIIAVEALRTHHELRHRAAMLLDVIDEEVDDAVGKLAEAEAHDEESMAAARLAWQEADAVGMAGQPWPPEDVEARLVDPVEQDLQTANDVLSGTQGESADSAKDRLGALRRRLAACRAWIETFD